MPELSRLATALGDRYVIERELGHGGMATVYLAQDPKHGRRVAIKVLRPELAAALGAERFLREIEIAAGLNHPHILPLYDSGEAAGHLYYVMPYVEGETLRQFLDREGTLPVSEAVRIAREVADGLSHAHSIGVIHRDIKPENIMLSGGHAVIADFGIARAASAAGGERLTQTGLAIGTPAYMSPEQGMGEEELDARSDLFSLGCVLYEMLVGEPPHAAANAQAILAKRVSQAAPSVRTLRKAIPKALDAVLSRALSSEPDDRQAGVAEFAEELGRTATGPEWVARPTGPLRLVGLYLLSAVAVLGLARLIVTQLELPRWVMPGAMVLLLIGFPVVLATALVQRGSISLPRRALRLLTWRSAMLGGVLAFGAWGVIVTGYMLTRQIRGGEADVTAAEPAIAVLPFRAVGPDLELWGEGMVDLLSTNLEGVAGLRKIDPRTIVVRWINGDEPSGERASADAQLHLAGELGASYAVTGSVVGSSDAVRISADVFDVDSGALRGHAQVDGPADSVLTLVDRLSLEILRTGLVPADTEFPPLDLRRTTTTSLPALKAYLSGEQKYRRSRWDEAAQEYRRAVDLDSTFALALYRLAATYGWSQSADPLEYADRAGRLAYRLPEREALLLEGISLMHRGRVDAVEPLLQVTERYPDDAEAWMQLGEAYIHVGGPGLYPAERHRQAMRRAIELDPYFGPAYVHLIWDSFFDEDSAGTDRLLTAFKRIDAETPVCGDFELGFALAWGSPAAREEALATVDSLGGAVFACTTPVLPFEPAWWERIVWLLWPHLAPDRPPSQRRYADESIYYASLKTGRIRQARELISLIRSERPLSAAGREAYLSLYFYPDSDAASQAAEALAGDDQPLSRFYAGALAAEAGRWNEVQDQVRALQAVAADVQAAGDSLGAVNRRAIARVLTGHGALRRGERSEAIDSLAATLPDLPGFGPGFQAMNFVRLELGRLMLQLGRSRDAQRYFESFEPHAIAARPIIELYLGQTYESLGQLQKAAAHYDRFVRWWSDCDPELMPWWETGRRSLERLTAELGAESS